MLSFGIHHLPLAAPSTPVCEMSRSHCGVYSFVFLGSGSLAQYEHVLGSDKLSYVVDRPSGQEEETFYVEGLAFPDADFSGLVSFSVTLLEVSDKVQYTLGLWAVQRDASNCSAFQPVEG